MPTPKMSEETARDVIARVEDALRKGGRPKGVNGPGRSAIRMAGEQAVKDGVVGTVNTFESRVGKVLSNYGMEPDWSLYAPARYHQPLPSARLDPAPPIAEDFLPDGDGEEVLIVPDLHQDPRHPHRLDVLRWIARFGAERKVPRVVQLGDWSTWDSVSAHDKNDTLKARLKPSIATDMDNLQEGLAAFQAEQGDWRPKKLVTLGNHEHRLERFENANPETHQTFTLRRDELFASFGWRTSPFGELRYIEGVAFTHHPTNGAGRAFGGKLGATRSANETTCSIVHGHTHSWKFWPAAKIGPANGIDILEAGCALDWGEIESYALHSQNDWWWGVTVARLISGRIIDVERVSMVTLRRRYG